MGRPINYRAPTLTVSVNTDQWHELNYLTASCGPTIPPSHVIYRCHEIVSRYGSVPLLGYSLITDQGSTLLPDGFAPKQSTRQSHTLVLRPPQTFKYAMCKTAETASVSTGVYVTYCIQLGTAILEAVQTTAAITLRSPDKAAETIPWLALQKRGEPYAPIPND